MPLPDTLTGKWRCVCPMLHGYQRDFNFPPEVVAASRLCPTCGKEPIILVRDEQSGSLDDREGQEFG